jgi:YidC/Oxa1 family membrane protein insertase
MLDSRSHTHNPCFGPSFLLLCNHVSLEQTGARALILPLSIQQSKSAEYMKALRPYITQIQEKFKNNENAKNQAVGRLYQDAEQNPLAGCLTSLFQLPIFLGLYRGIRLLALDGELEEPFLWIPSLQGPVTAETDYRGLDWLLQGWTANPDPSGFPYVPSLGWETTIAFLVMPVVLVCLQTATMRVLAPPNPTDDASMDESTKETMDRTQNILKFLPLMIGFFSLQVPAGLTIYWFTSNIFTLSSSLAVRAYFKANPPKIELPDYWDTLSADKDFADMTPDERRQAMEAGIRVGPTMEELIEESKFHFYVDRRNTKLLLASSAGADISSNNIPREMQDWVASGPPPLRRSHQQEPLGREPSSSVEVTANAAAAVVMEEAAAAAAKSSA